MEAAHATSMKNTGLASAGIASANECLTRPMLQTASNPVFDLETLRGFSIKPITDTPVQCATLMGIRDGDNRESVGYQRSV